MVYPGNVKGTIWKADYDGYRSDKRAIINQFHASEA